MNVGIERIKALYAERFQGTCKIISQAPGRINLIGEHTDYNMGMVMPAAINRSVLIGIGWSKDEKCRLYSETFNEEVSIDLDKLHRSDKSWVNYLIGILHSFQGIVKLDKGFCCVISSDIPIGAGMSSSAALECAFVLSLNELFETQLSRWRMIELIQESAHHFLGIKSGILDQFASLFGKKDKLMLMNCSDRKFSYVDFVLEDVGLLLVDSKVKHTHLYSAYNERVDECHSAIRKIQNVFPNIQSLSDSSLKLNMLEVAGLSNVEYHRASFIFKENKRVLACKKSFDKQRC